MHVLHLRLDKLQTQQAQGITYSGGEITLLDTEVIDFQEASAVVQAITSVAALQVADAQGNTLPDSEAAYPAFQFVVTLDWRDGVWTVVDSNGGVL